MEAFSQRRKTETYEYLCRLKDTHNKKYFFCKRKSFLLLFLHALYSIHIAHTPSLHNEFYLLNQFMTQLYLKGGTDIHFSLQRRRQRF